MNLLLKTIFIVCLIIPDLSFGQVNQQVKIMCYNLLNYPSTSQFVTDTTLRHPFYRSIISATDPDILVVEELNSLTGLNAFLNKVMNAQSTVYAAGTFKDGGDTDNGIFYKTSKFQFISNDSIHTALRTINMFKLVHLASGDTIRIFAVHLKASAGAPNDGLRAAEVDSLRKVTDALPAGKIFIVCGDFNIYNSTESAYLKLLQVNSGSEGHFYDPVSLSGTWNNPAYSHYHTQSTRLTGGNGSTGGLDDRFDMMLHSKAIQQGTKWSYVPNSLTAFGNDGLHFNDSIDKSPNVAVSAIVAAALHGASDHLPVYELFNVITGTIDVGVTSFVQPVINPCGNTNKLLKVNIKNFSNTTLDFSSNNVQVALSATNPSSVIQNFSSTISSGTLIAGASMEVLLTSAYNMSLPGNYLFNASSVSAADNNSVNNAMAQVTMVVNSVPAPTVTPSGTASICQGTGQVFTASSGTSYVWSNGSTTQSITASDSGLYSVTVYDNSGCSATSLPVHLVYNAVNPDGILFYEKMGIVTGTTFISVHENADGFDNDNLLMTGTGDVRITSFSTGYAGASGDANVFLTNSAGGKDFIISNINTTGLNSIHLSFGLGKFNNNSSNGSDFLIQYSINGGPFVNLTIDLLPIGGSGWYWRTVHETLPEATNLSIRFVNTGVSTTFFRIDDVIMDYSLVPLVTANRPVTFCLGDSVVLTAEAGPNYLWNNGATTQSIVVYNTGNYFVSTNCIASDPVSVSVNNNCTVSLSIHVFIQGYYTGVDEMTPVLYNTGLSADPTACDMIYLDLHSSSYPYSVIGSGSALLHTNGMATFTFAPSFNGSSFYVAIRHRNSIETWSKFPVAFNGFAIDCDFTTY